VGAVRAGELAGEVAVEVVAESWIGHAVRRAADRLDRVRQGVARVGVGIGAGAAAWVRKVGFERDVADIIVGDGFQNAEADAANGSTATSAGKTMVGGRGSPTRSNVMLSA